MIVATRAMKMAIAKAGELGVGVVTTVYHDHLGSSGKYVRMALKEGLIGISLSGRNAAPSYDRANSIRASIQGSPPLAFGMPGGDGRPEFLLDYASHFVTDDEDVRRNPAVYMKAIGMSHVANILSGTLGGQMLPEFDRRTTRFQGADQSGFHMALDVGRFTSPDAFKTDMDYLMDETAKMQPLPGLFECGSAGTAGLAEGGRLSRERHSHQHECGIVARGSGARVLAPGPLDLARWPAVQSEIRHPLLPEPVIVQTERAVLERKLDALSAARRRQLQCDLDFQGDRDPPARVLRLVQPAFHAVDHVIERVDCAVRSCKLGFRPRHFDPNPAGGLQLLSQVP